MVLKPKDKIYSPRDDNDDEVIAAQSNLVDAGGDAEIEGDGSP